MTTREKPNPLRSLSPSVRKRVDPTANYRIYLGQAYARQSLIEPALQNYRAALDSGQLDAKQAEEVRHAIESIESRRTP